MIQLNEKGEVLFVDIFVALYIARLFYTIFEDKKQILKFFYLKWKEVHLDFCEVKCWEEENGLQIIWMDSRADLTWPPIKEVGGGGEI